MIPSMDRGLKQSIVKSLHPHLFFIVQRKFVYEETISVGYLALLLINVPTVIMPLVFFFFFNLCFWSKEVGKGLTNGN